MRFSNEPRGDRAARAAAWVAVAACLLAALTPTSQAQTGLLNDTGQISCYSDTNVAMVCGAATTGNSGTRPHQDGRYGRDPAQNLSVLPAKTGAGAAGFDVTKIANNGSALADSAVLGTGATDWACTRDNVTGLVWEVKTTSGLRNTDHTYSWYSTTNNGGNAGNVGVDTCGGSMFAAPYNNQCNTASYVAAVNAVGLCGATDWRMPTMRELLGIVHNGLASGPVVDATYLPNTKSSRYWASDTYAPGPATAWLVNFNTGNTSTRVKSDDSFVRLVRSGQ